MLSERIGALYLQNNLCLVSQIYSLEIFASGERRSLACCPGIETSGIASVQSDRDGFYLPVARKCLAVLLEVSPLVTGSDCLASHRNFHWREWPGTLIAV